MARNQELKVAILTQLLPGSAGGIEVNLLSLLKALDSLDDSGRQVVIGPGGESHWLDPHLGIRQSILQWPAIKLSPVRPPNWLPSALVGMAKRSLGRYGLRIAAGIQPLLRRIDPGHISEGEKITRELIERGVQLVHFPYQRYFPTSLPTIFEPWDLQHRHYPEFFTSLEIDLRDEHYQMACKEATLVVTASEWTKRDLIQQFGLEPKKIAVIRRGPSVVEERRMTEQEITYHIQSLKLPKRFILYPAKTWPHKNHIRLFRALAELRDRFGILVPLVCTGKPVEGSWPRIMRSLEELSLERAVHFTGYLTDDQMAALFKRAEFLVFPTLFEGLGIPLLEAMQFGLPIVASKVTCLPEVAEDAALYFDPLSVDSIAEAILKAWQNPDLRKEYRTRGRVQIKKFNWDNAGRKFLLCYRHSIGYKLTGEESEIFNAMTGSTVDTNSVMDSEVNCGVRLS